MLRASIVAIHIQSVTQKMEKKEKRKNSAVMSVTGA